MSDYLNILIVFRACAVATVLIFSTTAAIIASAIPAMLAGRVIFPVTIRIRAVGRAPVNNLAAVPANFFPIAAIPRRIGIVVLAGRIFFVAAFGTNTARVEAMGFRVAISRRFVRFTRMHAAFHYAHCGQNSCCRLTASHGGMLSTSISPIIFST